MPDNPNAVLSEDPSGSGGTATADPGSRYPRDAALRDSEERLRAIVETAAEGIITIDERGLVESMNKAAVHMFGYAREEVVGRNVNVLMPSPDREAHQGYIGNYLRTGVPKIIGLGRQVTARRKDGSEFPIHLSVSEVSLADRRIFTGIIRDITESESARQQLSEFTLRLAEKKKAIEDQARLLNISHDAIFVWREPGGIEYWNRGAVALYGFQIEEVLGRSPTDLLHTGFPKARCEVLAQLRKDGSWQGELHQRTKDGREQIVSARFQTVSEANEPLRVLESAHDITAQKRLEREVLEISAGEQRRIGQDLHDDLCQRLASIQLMTGMVADDLQSVAPRQAARVSRIAEQIRETIDRAKMLARGLSLMAFESGGLRAGLEELVETSAKLFGVPCEFAGGNDVETTPVDINLGTQLYRIAQEAITNAVTHGQAKRIVLSLETSPGKWVLKVSDDGCGFSGHESGNRGMGLRTMKYRASTIGASLDLQSSPGQGTTVICRFAAPTPP